MKEFFITIIIFSIIYLIIVYSAKIPSECIFTRDPLMCSQIIKVVQNDR